MPILVSRSFASSAISTSSSSQRIVMICFISFASYGCHSIVSDPRVGSPQHRSFVQPRARPAALCHCGGMPLSCHAMAARLRQTGLAGLAWRPNHSRPLPQCVSFADHSRTTAEDPPSAAWHVVARLARSAGGTAACSTLANGSGGTHSRTGGGCCNTRPHRCNERRATQVAVPQAYHRRRLCLRRDDHQPIKQVDRHAVRRLERRAYLGTHSQQRALWRRGVTRNRHDAACSRQRIRQRRRAACCGTCDAYFVACNAYIVACDAYIVACDAELQPCPQIERPDAFRRH